MNIEYVPGLITINETMIIQMLSFLILVFILNRVMIRPLLATMKDRDDYLGILKKDANDSNLLMKDLQNQLDEKEKSVRAESLSMKKELEDEGAKEVALILADSKNEINELKEKTEQEVNSDIAKARDVLIAESEILAVDIMEKILSRRLAS